MNNENNRKLNAVKSLDYGRVVAEFNSVCTKVDAVYIDTSSVMHTAGQYILIAAMENNEALKCKAIFLLDSTLNELYNLQHKKGNILRGKLFRGLLTLQSKGTLGKVRVASAMSTRPMIADSDIVQHLFKRNREEDVLLISQDRQLLQDCRAVCNADAPTTTVNTPQLLTMHFNSMGILEHVSAEKNKEIAAHRAASQLAGIVETTTLCIEEGALQHAQAKDFLLNVEMPLLQRGSQLVVLAYKIRQLPHSRMLVNCSMGHAPTVRFVFLDDTLSHEDAVVEALLQVDTDISFVSDNKKLIQGVCRRFSFSRNRLFYYSINRYGFLSKVNEIKFGNETNTEFQCSVLESAIKADDQKKFEQFLRIRPGADILEHGIRVALKEKKDEYLKSLAFLLDKVSPKLLSWWVLKYPPFAAPDYLEKNELHFHILTDLLRRAEGLEDCDEAYARLKKYSEVAYPNSKLLLNELMEYFTKQRKMDLHSAKSPEERVKDYYKSMVAMTQQPVWPLVMFFLLGMEKRHAKAGIRLVDLTNFTTEAPMLHRFNEYIASFPESVQNILHLYQFHSILSARVSNELLTKMIQITASRRELADIAGSEERFCECMSYLIKMRQKDENPGLPPDTVLLISELLSAIPVHQEKASPSVWDPACGSADLLHAFAKSLKSEEIVNVYGRDCSPEAIADAKVMAMCHGGEPEHFIVQKEPHLSSEDDDNTYDYVITAPPMAMKTAAQLDGEFSAGAPVSSEAVFMHLLSGVSALASHGKMAILMPTSASCDMKNSCDKIRRLLIERDWLECIIHLPGGVSYAGSTPMNLWVLCKQKRPECINKVLFIDASKYAADIVKSDFGRYRAFPASVRRLIVKAYCDFEDKHTYPGPGNVRCHTRVIDTEHLKIHKIIVETPRYNESGKVVHREGKLLPNLNARKAFLVSNETPESFFRTKIFPKYTDSWYEADKVVSFYDFRSARFFYEENQDLLQCAEKKMKSLQMRMKDLSAELKARTQYYLEQIRYCAEQLAEMQQIADFNLHQRPEPDDKAGAS